MFENGDSEDQIALISAYSTRSRASRRSLLWLALRRRAWRAAATESNRIESNRIECVTTQGIRGKRQRRTAASVTGDVVDFISVRMLNASSSGSSKARKSEVERLHGAVAKLADLVGGLAPQNREVKARVSEIIASVS